MQISAHSVSKFDSAKISNVVDINHASSFTSANLYSLDKSGLNPSLSNPRQNQLFATLAEAELSSFEADLELVYLSRNQILCESNETPTYMYFPTTAVVSLQYLTDMGSSSEVAVVGNEGMVGVSLLMSGTKSMYQAQVHSEGYCYRLRAQLAQKLISNSNTMLTMLLRYLQSMFSQVAQTAVCNRHHSVDQQLSRRLLMSLDRLTSNDIMLTQETISNMLGVRRETVTEAALKLQDAGAIKYSRGHITVLNRQLLEKRSCECYAIDRYQVEKSLAGNNEHGRAFPCNS